MADDLVIELDVVCKKCGDGLQWSADFNRQHTYVLDVEPCGSCLQKSAEAGVP